jgi:hypothetical protein
VYGATGTVYFNYNLSVPAANNYPSISYLYSRGIYEDSTPGAISFTVSDVETAAGSLYVTASTSNSSLIPSWGIYLGGSGSYRTVTVYPAANKYGSANITLTVRDGGGLTRSSSFVVTVYAVNDSPYTGSDYGTRLPNCSIAFYIPKLLANDSDPDGNSLSLHSVTSRSSWGGTVVRSGSYIYYYPPAGHNSGDSFHYTVSDGYEGYAWGTVSIGVSSYYGTTYVY